VIAAEQIRGGVPHGRDIAVCEYVGTFAADPVFSVARQLHKGFQRAFSTKLGHLTRT
jgi:hypothetical protein